MNIASECFDNSIRAEQILWLSCQADQYTDEIEDFFGDEEPKELERIFGIKIPRDLLEDGRDGVGEIVSFLYRKGLRGFLVQIATPIPQIFHESGFTHYGFGEYTTRWFYTETLDGEFIAKVLAWKESFVADRRKKDAAKKVKPKAV